MVHLKVVKIIGFILRVSYNVKKLKQWQEYKRESVGGDLEHIRPLAISTLRAFYLSPPILPVLTIITAATSPALTILDTLSAFSIFWLIYVLFTMTQWHRCCYCHLHFTDEEIEAQRGYVTCPRTHSQLYITVFPVTWFSPAHPACHPVRPGTSWVPPFLPPSKLCPTSILTVSYPDRQTYRPCHYHQILPWPLPHFILQTWRQGVLFKMHLRAGHLPAQNPSIGPEDEIQTSSCGIRDLS